MTSWQFSKAHTTLVWVDNGGGTQRTEGQANFRPLFVFDFHLCLLLFAGVLFSCLEFVECVVFVSLWCCLGLALVLDCGAVVCGVACGMVCGLVCAPFVVGVVVGLVFVVFLFRLYKSLRRAGE